MGDERLTTQDPAPGEGDAAFDRVLNEFLVRTYRAIERYEEKSLRVMGGLDLTSAEAHMVEAVGLGQTDHPEGVPVTQLAEMLDVRVPSATAQVKRLTERGLLTKERSASDGRSVVVRLTQQGRRAYRLHAGFHRHMVQACAGQLSAEERRVFASSLQKLADFFNAAADETDRRVAAGITHPRADAQPDEGCEQATSH